jgi:hypothetical protein
MGIAIPGLPLSFILTPHSCCKQASLVSFSAIVPSLWHPSVTATLSVLLQNCFRVIQLDTLFKFFVQLCLL